VRHLKIISFHFRGKIHLASGVGKAILDSNREVTSMASVTTKDLPSRETRAEIGKKARAFYEPLREKLEKEHWGEYITIHPENGDYVISPNHWDAVKEMRAKYPDILFHTIRIGYRAFGHFGGRGEHDRYEQKIHISQELGGAF
jgi:hypothetical protein